MKNKKVRFQNPQGDQLDGELSLPVGKGIKAFALFAHCFTCSKSLRPVKELSRSLTAGGYAVFKFDFTGLGKSEGDFSDTNFSGNVEDLITAADFMRKEYRAPALLIGHSLGGAAVLKAAAEIEEVKGVATIGAPFDPEHVTNLFEGDKATIEKEGLATVSLAGRKFTIKKQFLDDLQSKRVIPRLRELGKSLLIMHSPQDRTVGIENAAMIYEHAMHPKSFISLDGADHLMSNPRDAQYAGQVIANWALRYIPDKETELPSKYQLVAELDEEDQYTTELQAGEHRIVADEPKKIGGNNLGPSPSQLVLSGLGACTAMTVMMYIRRKEWPLEKIRVHISYKREKNDNGEAHLFDRKIELLGPDLSEEQRKRCLEIANKCPVHRLLDSGATISTTLLKNDEE